ncbi:MAG TPA: DUF2726 domain-containing protein [Polaromonas sp.]|jgi:hypothetical protein
MLNPTTLLIGGLAAALGALVGALLAAWWWRKKAGDRPRLPAKLPLGARGLVTTTEHEVWTWLRHTFRDHVVMVKLPVSRFTIPRDSEEVKSMQWLELLNGVYTTFTVCTTDGKVVGCVDVPGKRGLSTANRELKEDLLSDCGIAYTVVRSTRLPTGNAMRAAFLGEILVDQIDENPDTLSGDSGFHAELDAFTKQKVQARKEAALQELNKEAQNALQAAQNRGGGFNPDGTGPIRGTNKPGRRGEPTFDDSFIHPHDTRPAKLE